MTLQNQLVRFGLNPAHWRWSITSSRELVLIHKRDPSFRFRAYLNFRSTDVTLKDIQLLSV